MLNAVKIKLLVALLAALALIGAAVLKIEKHESAIAAAAQQKVAQEAETRKHDEEFRKNVEEKKKKNHANAGNEGKTWRDYQP